MPSISLPSGTISYFEQGSGPPVVLLHATLHDHHDFDAIAGSLARHHRVIAVDWPHHGDSGPLIDGTAPSADAFCDVLEAFVLQLALEPAVYIGNSVGGLAASRLAIRHPDRVAGLVLVNSGGYTRQSLLVRGFFRWYGRPSVIKRLLPWTVGLYMQSQSPADDAISARAKARARTPEGSRVAASLWRSFGAPENDLSGRAHQITAPTLLLWGERDRVARIKDARRAARLIPDATLVALPAGHVPFSSRPDAFLSHAWPFIERAFERQTTDRAAGREN